MCCTFLYAAAVLQLCAFSARACLPACCIVFPLEGENFSTAAAASAPIANIVLKAAITVPLRSLAPAKQQKQAGRQAAPRPWTFASEALRTGRTLSPAAVTWIFNGASQRVCVRDEWHTHTHTHTHGSVVYHWRHLSWHCSHYSWPNLKLSKSSSLRRVVVDCKLLGKP